MENDADDSFNDNSDNDQANADDSFNTDNSVENDANDSFNDNSDNHSNNDESFNTDSYNDLYSNNEDSFNDDSVNAGIRQYNSGIGEFNIIDASEGGGGGWGKMAEAAGTSTSRSTLARR